MEEYMNTSFQFDDEAVRQIEAVYKTQDAVNRRLAVLNALQLKAGERVWADCPECGDDLPWWIPGNPKLIEADPYYHDKSGLLCDSGDCGYRVMLGPPEILCSRCGEALVVCRPDGEELCYGCPPCRRVVRP